MRRNSQIIIVLIMILILAGCSGVSRTPKIDDGIVTSETASVRSSVAEISVEVDRVSRGDEVEILQYHGDEWVKVRTANGAEGWLESRVVSRKALVEEANALAKRVEDIPAQAEGQLSGPTRLRLWPGRASDENVILTLPRETSLQVLDRQRTLRQRNQVLAKTYQPRRSRFRRSSSGDNGQTKPQYDAWYQVRFPQSFLVGAGWVYAPLVDLQIPIRLVRLQEDYLIVGWFEVGQVEDSEIGLASHYLALGRHRFSPVPGTDFNRLELFWWDLDEHQYQRSARSINGILPVYPQNRDGAWQFRFKAFDRKTGQLEEVGFLVDVGNPFRPRFVRSKK